MHMKTFTHSPFFGHKVGYLLVGRVFFYSRQPKSSQESSCFTCQTGKQKNKGLWCHLVWGGIGIVVENLHVKEIKSLSRKKPLGLLFNHTLPHHSIYPLTRPESGLIIYIYTSMYKYISTVRVSLRYESLFLDEGQRL